MNLHLLCTKNNVNPSIMEKHKDEDWIGIDYGAYMLVENGITPIAVFGDFDSVSEEEKKAIEEVIDIDYLPAEKNETDLEVGMNYALSLDYHNVYIHGATGGRLDHFLGNLQTLVNPEVIISGSEFYIVDDQNTIQVLVTGTHIVEKEADKTYVSFLPVKDGVLLTLEGFKYEVDRFPVTMGYTRTVSNEFLNERAEVTVESGMVYMIQSKA